MKQYPDNRYYKDIFDTKCYDHLPDKRNVILDIGANAGMFSLWVANDADIIYAIEPHFPTYLRLLTTIMENNLTNVIPLWLAIAGDNGTRTLYSDGVDGGNSLVNVYEKGEQQVACLTLATLVETLRLDTIDILKIDVEGAEEEIFATAFPHDKIKFIIGENHGKNDKEILKSVGYTYTTRNYGVFTATKL